MSAIMVRILLIIDDMIIILANANNGNNSNNSNSGAAESKSSEHQHKHEHKHHGQSSVVVENPYFPNVNVNRNVNVRRRMREEEKNAQSEMLNFVFPLVQKMTELILFGSSSSTSSSSSSSSVFQTRNRNRSEITRIINELTKTLQNAGVTVLMSHPEWMVVLKIVLILHQVRPCGLDQVRFYFIFEMKGLACLFLYTVVIFVPCSCGVLH